MPVLDHNFRALAHKFQHGMKITRRLRFAHVQLCHNIDDTSSFAARAATAAAPLTIAGMITLLGAVGRGIAYALNHQAAPYRVVGRDRAALTKSFGNDQLAEIITWDPNDAASARAALRGSDTIVYLIGVPYHQFPLPP